jgi:hypothetical protein
MKTVPAIDLPEWDKVYNRLRDEYRDGLGLIEGREGRDLSQREKEIAGAERAAASRRQEIAGKIDVIQNRQQQRRADYKLRLDSELAKRRELTELAKVGTRQGLSPERVAQLVEARRKSLENTEEDIRNQLAMVKGGKTGKDRKAAVDRLKSFGFTDESIDAVRGLSDVERATAVRQLAISHLPSDQFMQQYLQSIGTTQRPAGIQIRDRKTGEVTPVTPAQLEVLRKAAGFDNDFEVISQ